MHAFVAGHPCASCGARHDLCHRGCSWLTPGVPYYYTCPKSGDRVAYRRPETSAAAAVGRMPARSVALDDG